MSIQMKKLKTVIFSNLWLSSRFCIISLKFFVGKPHNHPIYLLLEVVNADSSRGVHPSESINHLSYYIPIGRYSASTCSYPRMQNHV